MDKIILKPMDKIHRFYESIFLGYGNHFSLLIEKMSPITHLWTRLTSAHWEDAWIERLSFAGPENLVIKAFPASRTLRLQVYTNKKTGKKLCSLFGGSLRPFHAAAWKPPQTSRRKPLSIAGRLYLHNDAATFLADKENRSSQKKSHPLLIPADMAFGTGEHATTHSCLRLLCDVEKTISKNSWSLLDLGTGSGILALAGELLGAKKILAIDNDPRCVSIAKENAQSNNLSRSTFCTADVLAWKFPGKWNVITANIYSSILSCVTSKIERALAPDGHLILSGILTVEEKDIVSIFEKQGLVKIKNFARGKWCALHFQKS